LKRKLGEVDDCIDNGASITSMGQIVIRNIDTAVIEALRRLGEIRRIIGRLDGPSTVDDLRRDRNRDER
jgi:hypothetical protein